jgi:hypothetical protein
VRKYKIGQKVKILSKSVDMPAGQSRVYKRCVEQGYGIIVGNAGTIGIGEYKYNVSWTKEGMNGGFLESDLVPYHPYINLDDAFEALVKGEITPNQYNETFKTLSKRGEEHVRESRFPAPSELFD